MTKEVVILIADDDSGHTRLIEKNLSRAGLKNTIKKFENGQEVVDYFFGTYKQTGRSPEISYLLLLDIRMPKLDGIQVLQRLKKDAELCKMPVIMLTTTDDPREVGRCHQLGCNSYIVKPVEYDKFAEAITNLGLYISMVEVPELTNVA